MFAEYDVIKSAIEIDEMVPKGTLGTILMVFEDGVHYEVEFVDKNGETIKVLTIALEDIERV